MVLMLQLPQRCIIYLIVSRTTKVTGLQFISRKRLKESIFSSLNVCHCSKTSTTKCRKNTSVACIHCQKGGGVNK